MRPGISAATATTSSRSEAAAVLRRALRGLAVQHVGREARAGLGVHGKRNRRPGRAERRELVVVAGDHREGAREARVAELRAAGVNVAFGQDCTMDPWYPLGSADMLEVAHMGIHAAPMTSRDAMAWAFDRVTLGGALALGLPDPTLRTGGPANMVLLQARDRIEAVRLKATRLAVIRGGRVLSRTPARVAALSIDGRPDMIDPAAYAPPEDA